jgi:hypothetical protein
LKDENFGQRGITWQAPLILVYPELQTHSTPLNDEKFGQTWLTWHAPLILVYPFIHWH